MRVETIHVVTWDDAHGNTQSFEEREVEHKPYRFTSIGFLIRTDAIGVSLAREVGEDGRYRDHEFIPRAMVIKEQTVGPLREPRRPKESNGHQTRQPRQSRTNPTAQSILGPEVPEDIRPEE